VGKQLIHRAVRRFTTPAFVLLTLFPRILAGQSSGDLDDAQRIRPGDVVRLSVLRDETLSGEFQVNQFGTVVLPLVGEYDVTVETQRSLRQKVIADLREIRQAPDIELVVLRRVRVVGEVNEPGVYPLDPTMSVADAVALAKGRTQFAQEGRVILRRGGEVVDGDLRLETPLLESPVRSGDEILVPRRSWLDRNAGAVIGGASALIGLMVTLIIR
jgi:protein involved in polysaccharide export with SLBB domain